ncbi:MAG: hypothetical protein USCAAHI_02093 [Beijerinckiaceae bacterium]|nr:MAG: hypothetical protein USCAAHI_02093 [Beijerinckiaceae bacterium]
MAPAEATAAETATHMAAAETTAHMAATECQGGTARGQRRAKRGRGQQYTEASHRSLLAVYGSKDSRGRNTGLVENDTLEKAAQMANHASTRSTRWSGC